MIFFQIPNFSVPELKGEDVVNFLPFDKHAAWKEYFQILPFFLSDMKDSSMRFVIARKRFTYFEDLVDFHPFILLLFAEALFWLSDADGCLVILKKLQSRIPDSEQLRSIVNSVEEIANDERRSDDEYFETGGLEGEFLVVPFSTPFSCPILETSSEEIKKIIADWEDVQQFQESACQYVLRLACLASNILENVFEVEGSSWTRLICSGFYQNSIEGISKTSKEKKKERIIQILKNTEQALSLISACLDDYTMFTPSFLKTLHNTLFHNDWFIEEPLEEEDYSGGSVVRLMKVGAFRTVACCTSHSDDEGTVELTQYCHHSIIATEIDSFCTRVQDLLAQGEIDPFMKAAWIQWAFLRIHPFEDGNGRVSRIISSIPLYKLGLPPIVVKKEKKDFYFNALKAADKENELFFLSAFLKDSLVDGIREVRDLPKQMSKPIGVTRKRRVPGSAATFW